MPDRPGAVVVLPTFRRPAGLDRALAALARQADPGLAWSVVVIDNDDGAEAAEVFAARRSGLPEEARLIREPRRGSAFARNAGIAAVDRQITVFLDDDVVPADDWLERLLEPIVAGRCEGSGGRVLLDPTVARPGWFDELAIGGYLARWDLADQERELARGETVVTSNCAYRTDILKRTGGFDARLGPRENVPLVNDDALVTRKFQDAGGRVRFVPAALVVHDLPPQRLRRSYLLRRAYAHGRSDWIMDRDVMAAGRAKGAGSALRTLRHELAGRAREGLSKRGVAFHAACDIARAAGSLREAVTLIRESR
jgi:glucosyl-dolichyl phosphate glucuronosyltransferase